MTRIAKLLESNHECGVVTGRSTLFGSATSPVINRPSNPAEQTVGPQYVPGHPIWLNSVRTERFCLRTKPYATFSFTGILAHHRAHPYLLFPCLATYVSSSINAEPSTCGQEFRNMLGPGLPRASHSSSQTCGAKGLSI